LGGAIGFLYAASYPDEIDFLISLDIASPSVKNITKLASLTGDYIDKFLKYDLLTLDSAPCYEYKEMLKIVESAYEGSITTEAAEILMKRGIQAAYKKDEYYFSRDPKLKVKLTHYAPSKFMILVKINNNIYVFLSKIIYASSRFHSWHSCL
jgi:pimeloyl-ACP methyl ester carboxylesterase